MDPSRALMNRLKTRVSLAIARFRVLGSSFWHGIGPLSIFPALLLFLSGFSLALIPPTSVPLEMDLEGDYRVAGDLLVLLQPETAELRIENGAGSRENGTWDFGAFQVQKNGSQVVIRDNRKPVIQPSELTFPFRTGTKVVIVGTGSIEVEDGTKKVELVADFPTVVTQFPLVAGNWKPTVDLVVPDNQINQGWLRSIALAVSIFAFAVMIRSAFSWLREAGRTRLTRPSATTLVVGIGGLVSAFLVPSQYDEGWILHRSESFLARGYFGNIYTVSDASLVQGNWLEALYALAIFLGFENIHFRLLLIAVNVLNWILIRRLILFLLRRAGYAHLNRLAEISAAASFVVINFGFSSAMRPESILTLFFTSLLVCLALFFQTHNPVWLLFASLSSAISITVHQSGLAFVPPIVVAFAYLGGRTFSTTQQENRISSLQDASRILFISFSAFLVLLHAFQDFSSLSRNYVIWSGSSFHQLAGISGELGRYQEMLGMGGAPWVLAVGVIGFSLISLVGAIIRKAHVSFFVAAGLAPLGLVLTASKWPWHLGVLAATAALLWATLAVLFSTVWNLSRVQKFVVSAGLAAVFTWLLRGATPLDFRERYGTSFTNWLRDYVPDFLRTLFPIEVSQATLLMVPTVLAFCVALALLLVLGVRAGSGAMSLMLLATVSLAVSDEITQNQVGPDWFQTRDRVAQFFKDGPVGSCGLYSESSVVSSISSLGYLENSGSTLRNILDAVGSEGTQSPPEGFTKPSKFGQSDEGEIATRSNQQVFPLDEKPAGGRYGLWIFGLGEVTPEVAMEFLGPSREVINREVFNIGRTEGWELRIFQSTPDARYLRVTTPLLEPELFLVSPIFQVEFSPAAEVIRGENFLDGPSKFQWSSCAEKVVVTGRSVSDVNYFSNDSVGWILENSEKLIQVSLPEGPKVFSWDPRVSVSYRR